MSNIVSMLQLRRELNLTDYKVKKLLDKGLPFIVAANRDTGQQWEFNIEECREWIEQFEEDNGGITTKATKEIEQARIKKLNVQTAREQLRLDRERGEVVPIDHVIEIVAQMFASLRAHLLAIPHKVSPVVVGQTDVKEVDKLLTHYIKEALEELQQDKVLISPEFVELEPDIVE